MTDSLMARCGINCGECKYREQMSCPGCVGTQGKPFWGECSVAMCCIGKGLEHCGQCQDMPCDMLKEFAYHPTEGDNGKRIQNLQEWNEKGYDGWRAKRNRQ